MSAETAVPMHLEGAGEPQGKKQVLCPIDGTPFTPKRSWQKWCSDKCRNAHHAEEARKAAIRDAAPQMFDALKLIAAGSCERLTSGPGSCWSQPGWSKDAEFGADRWCQPCIALAAIIDLKPPEVPKALLEKPKA